MQAVSAAAALGYAAALALQLTHGMPEPDASSTLKRLLAAFATL